MVKDGAFRSLVVSDINTLQSKIIGLRSEIKMLMDKFTCRCSSTAEGYCFIYVRVKSGDGSNIMKEKPESM